jgi:protein-disulfide isomerase
MMTTNRTLACGLALAVIAMAPRFCHAQFLGPQPSNSLQNISQIQPPAGSKVAIVVFEDLGCPACAHAHPIEAKAAAAAHVPLLRFDFPFEEHIWTFQGAVCARYIQKKISPSLADQYRSDVFSNQRMIASKDDLQQFTQQWLQHHGQQMPFVLDPDGSLAKAVRADYDLGRKINVHYTPTVIVVTANNYQIVCGVPQQAGANDPDKILPVVEAALSEKRSSH